MMKKLPITFFANVEPWIRKPQNHTDIKFHDERFAGDYSPLGVSFLIIIYRISQLITTILRLGGNLSSVYIFDLFVCLHI